MIRLRRGEVVILAEYVPSAIDHMHVRIDILVGEYFSIDKAVA